MEMSRSQYKCGSVAQGEVCAGDRDLPGLDEFKLRKKKRCWIYVTVNSLRQYTLIHNTSLQAPFSRQKTNSVILSFAYFDLSYNISESPTDAYPTLYETLKVHSLVLVIQTQNHVCFIIT